jgi:hypothetical protein
MFDPLSQIPNVPPEVRVRIEALTEGRQDCAVTCHPTLDEFCQFGLDYRRNAIMIIVHSVVLPRRSPVR